MARGWWFYFKSAYNYGDTEKKNRQRHPAPFGSHKQRDVERDEPIRMRHQKTKHKLSRTSAHRKALLMNLSKQIIEHERIETTSAKARAVKPEVERLITLAKRSDLHARRQALSRLAQDKFAVHKLFEDLAPRYAERPGGYTRILKLGPRRSDATEMVFIELV
jgi:large subunit ribosomal protein L17